MSIPKVSIIIPVFNVSKYLPECLDSVINQTLKDIEIIIVNDASPDPLDDKICKEYTAKDSRIVYVTHTKNLGLGGARNTGIALAEAEFIGSVDSDDYIDPKMFEILYNNIIDSQADISVCGISLVDETEVPLQKYKKFEDSIVNITSNTDIFLFPGQSFLNKLWRKNLFKN